MHTTKPHKPHPALAEVHRAAHSQDLVQISKRSQLERKSENHEIHLPRTKHGENRIEQGI
jgi:hypothetical protein